MTRNAEHTPSPQSVVVPVEPTEAMLSVFARQWHMRDFPSERFDHATPAYVEACKNTMRECWASMLAAAPAPSSLAGGEASPLVQRLAYGYAIMHTAICHMAGTSGASPRWYYDKANEAFGRVSPIHSITEDSNPHVNGDYFSGLSNFLAALSPEAPAREGVKYTIRQEYGFGITEHDPALTPRHEAPASEGYDEAKTDAWNDFEGDHLTDGNGYATAEVYRLCREAFDAAWPQGRKAASDAALSAFRAKHEVPAEGAGGIASAARALLDACYKADENSDLSDFVDGMLLTRLDKALRSRSSAPEARDGRVTWHSSGEDEGPDVGLQLDLGDGRSLWVGEGQKPFGWQISIVHGDEITPVADVIDHERARELFDILAALPHPAAPSADKLRIAVEALEPFANLGVSSGPDDEPCHYAYRITRGAIRNARQALAALKAEDA